MWREKPKKCYLCNNENAYGQGRVESDPEVVLKKRKVGLFGKQEHKNISRPQPWKLFQNMTKSKKNTTKTRKNHTRITSSSYFSCQTLASCLEGLVLGASFSVRHWHAKNSLVTSRANGAEVRYRSSLGVPCSGMAFRLLRSRASCGRTVP